MVREIYKSSQFARYYTKNNYYYILIIKTKTKNEWGRDGLNGGSDIKEYETIFLMIN